ncbi:hypothetical protein [Rhodoblastus sp.]|uniref:hypothetical protein n=1 Tax=Rhodoblastus sp. TaxID=1962975 RepID=UPI003F961E73
MDNLLYAELRKGSVTAFVVRLRRVRIVFLSERAAVRAEVWLAHAMTPNEAT